MKTEIYPIALGVINAYLVKEEGIILVDSGPPNQEEKFLKELKKISIEPEDISLIFLTHGHWDHIGSANNLKRITGCKVAVNQHEKDWVEKAYNPAPTTIGAWGKILGTILKRVSSSMSFSGTPVDLVLEDREYSLEEYGIHGKVFHTPGHTLGSMSLILDSGDAFVGDLAVNGLPLRIGPGRSIFIENMEALKESWRLILAKGAKMIFPAHGKPFKASVLEKLL